MEKVKPNYKFKILMKADYAKVELASSARQADILADRRIVPKQSDWLDLHQLPQPYQSCALLDELQSETT